MLAKDLGMTLGQLREQVSEYELLLWAAFYEMQIDASNKGNEKARLTHR